MFKTDLNDNHSVFRETFKKDCFVSIHTGSLQFLAIEMYKLAKGICATIIRETFNFQNNRKNDLSSQNTFWIPFRNSIYNSTN